MRKPPLISIYNKVSLSGKTQTDLLIERFDKMNEPYTLTMSGYTDVIENSKYRYLITNEAVNPIVFAANNKIKKDIKESNVIIDFIPREAIKYYIKPRANLNLTGCKLIDINNAYPNVLINNNIIKKETFDFLMKLPKLDRLKSIGMLATNKIKLKFLNGEVIEEPEHVHNEELANYFFFCCFEIGEILRQTESIPEEKFLFSWFDGIYMEQDEEKENETELYINSCGYECKKINLEIFTTKENRTNGNLKISWKEENKEIKTLNLNSNKPNNKFSHLKNVKQWKTNQPSQVQMSSELI